MTAARLTTKPGEMRIEPGEQVDGFASVGRGPYTVSEADLLRVSLLRGACIAAAWNRSTFRYGDLAALLGLVPQGMGRSLDLLSVDCARRGEPSLAALLVTAETGRCSEGFVGDAEVERERCYSHWLQRRASR
jgi:hypothetical protein